MSTKPQRDEEGNASAIVLMLSEAAATIFEEWIRDNDGAVREAAGLYKGFLGKLRDVVLRLALVAELLAWAAGNGHEPTTISAATLVGVLGFVDDYAKPSAVRVFGDAALPLSERNAAALG
ncbi:hypothetical protein QFZ54_004071 [Sphingomonas faeni]|nr:hypothetical protein [Sphingomonas faeni]